ncbi:ribonuclease HII [Wolbachia endosymbiont of Pentidionis agamae]|uniref:ribonuclease HII n=1 Tax=Wolbachia endosymbiont of Pentidionis agamae TaxID=3110435 RepID=UPI002FD51EF3
MKYPDLSLENELSGIVAGVDEVGRGALAGPVVSAAVVFNNREIAISNIRDSKRLSPKQRKILYHDITLNAKVALGISSIQEINAYNILEATKLSMKRALINLNLEIDYALVDGNQPPKVKWQTQSIINGDNISISIAAASIIAKVTRDELMQELHDEFPQYNWYQNKGYGTKEHINAIQNLGVTIHHRKNFCTKFIP